MKSTPIMGLTGLALNYAVAKAEGLDVYVPAFAERPWLQYRDCHGQSHHCPAYSTDPSAAYPIIERERMDTTYDHDWVYASEEGEDNNDRWYGQKGDHWAYGPTPLIAAMRCYCFAHYGDTVEVPEELL